MTGTNVDFRTLGEAETFAEQRIERVMQLFEPLAGLAPRYSKIAIGITNVNWLVETSDSKYFVKVYGENTSRMIDRESALIASERAGQIGVGPRLIASFSDPGAEVYEFLEGFRNCAAEDLVDPLVRKNVLSAYRKMHALAPLPLTRTGFDQLRQRKALVDAEGIALPEDIHDLLEACQKAEDAALRTGISLSVCHNDSYAPNFMIDANKNVRIVDWEYASNNDRTWDLAMIALSSMLPPGEVDILEEYFGDVPETERAKLVMYGGALAVSWGMWALLQTQYSRIEFDYLAYSGQLFGLARSLIQSKEWEAALCRY